MSTVRERILQAARQHFREVGARHARVQVICEAAGVSRTSFYREFRNVDDVAASLAVQRWTQSYAAAVDSVAALPLRPAWVDFMLSMARKSSQRTGWGSRDDSLIHVIGLMYRDNAAYLQEMVEAVRPFIERSQQAGVLRTDVSVERLADFVFRQVWAMASVPYPGTDTEGEWRQYIDAFVLPSLLLPAPAGPRDEQILDLLHSMAARLDRLASPAPR